MIVCENKQLNDLLKSNESFRINFSKLLLAFEERRWTRDVCNLFKALCEDLFSAYEIKVKVHIVPSNRLDTTGGGRFEIEFLDKPPKKKLDRGLFSVLKWMVGR